MIDLVKSEVRLKYPMVKKNGQWQRISWDEALNNIASKLEDLRQKEEIFKPKVDTRYDDVEVVSHNHNKIMSTPVESSNEILLLGSTCDVIGIDEAQFFDEGIVEVANQLANNGIRVVIAGLDMDFLGRPFGPMPYLMATAEYVTKVHAICKKTGNLANYSMRISQNQDLVQLGETDSYEAVSRRVFVDDVLNKK
jgi:thymidine kinase